MSTAAAPAAQVENPYLAWRLRYYHDPVGMVRDTFGVEPDEWQAKVMREVAAGKRRISIRSGHGVGKTTVLAWIIVWWMLTRFPQKTVATAPTTAQLFDALAAETKSWLGKLPDELKILFNVKSDRIELVAAPDDSFASFRTSRPETPEALAGIHSEHVLVIGDEASGIPEQVYEAGKGSMSGHSAVTILAGNPVRTSGTFFDSHNRLAEQWATHHVSCLMSPRVAEDFVAELREQYGEDSNAFRVRVLGEFPRTDDDTIIPYEKMAAALTRDVVAKLVKPVWGLDVGRFGDDPTALVKRRGNVQVGHAQERKGWDTMQVVGWVKAEYDACTSEDRPVEILVDSIGLGAGVVDRLIELGLPARGINVSESPAMTERFRNLRAELWWKAREWFIGMESCLAGDQKTGAELASVRMKYTSTGKIQVEGKDEMKKRGVRSPNRADAFVLTFAGDAAVALHGNDTRVSWKEPLKRIIKGLV